jgi:hypothetical protein
MAFLAALAVVVGACSVTPEPEAEWLRAQRAEDLKVAAGAEIEVASMIGKQYAVEGFREICPILNSGECRLLVQGQQFTVLGVDHNAHGDPYIRVAPDKGDVGYVRYNAADIGQYESTQKRSEELKGRLAAIHERCKTPTRIGMNEDQVVNSCWGAPQTVNTTRTGRHVHEQWVYPRDQYLYFDDGILRTMQTRD